MKEVEIETEEMDPQIRLLYNKGGGLVGLTGGRCQVCDLEVRIDGGPNQGGYLMRKMLGSAFTWHNCIKIESWPPQAGDVWITREDNGDVRLWSIIESDIQEGLRALLAKGLDAGDNDRDPIGLVKLNPRLAYRYGG